MSDLLYFIICCGNTIIGFITPFSSLSLSQIDAIFGFVLIFCLFAFFVYFTLFLIVFILCKQLVSQPSFLGNRTSTRLFSDTPNYQIISPRIEPTSQRLMDQKSATPTTRPRGRSFVLKIIIIMIIIIVKNNTALQTT